MKKIIIFCLFFLIIIVVNAESFCSLSFSGDKTVENAKIFINDEQYGYVPKKISTLLPGIYRIRLEKDHYETLEFFLDLTEDENTSLDLEMKPILEEAEE